MTPTIFIKLQDFVEIVFLNKSAKVISSEK
jgi:hypothetical protein